MPREQNQNVVFAELDRLTQHLFEVSQRKGHPVPQQSPIPPPPPVVPGGSQPAIPGGPLPLGSQPAVTPLPPPSPLPPRDQPTNPKSYPIVLVPGFLGWCTPFLGHYNYFGGFVNIAAILASQGWSVICPQIGPVSSNYERACEIYAQLTHGSMDGKTFDIKIDYGVPIPGTNVYFQPNPPPRRQAISFNLPEEWKWDKDHPVHFVAHSQGGNTCRYLIHLLESGNCAERSSYFREKKFGWVRSLTTLATPHNGSGIIDVLEEMGTAEDVLLDKIILAASYTAAEERGFDFCLDHRGLCPPDLLSPVKEKLKKKQEENDWENIPVVGEIAEDLLSYMERLSGPDGALTKWRASTYNGFHDNSIVGVVGDLNKIIGPPSPDVYYFTMSFMATVGVPQLALELEDVLKLPAKVEEIWGGVRDIWKRGKRLIGKGEGENAPAPTPDAGAIVPTTQEAPSKVEKVVGGVVGKIFSYKTSSSGAANTTTIGADGSTTSITNSFLNSTTTTATSLLNRAKSKRQSHHHPQPSSSHPPPNQPQPTPLPNPSQHAPISFTGNDRAITTGNLLLTLLKHIFGPASTLQSIAIWAINRINSRITPLPPHAQVPPLNPPLTPSPMQPLPDPTHPRPRPSNPTNPKLPLPSSTVPRFDMFPAFLMTAYGMCSFILSPTEKELLAAVGGPINDEAWRVHDGVVPTVSMAGPWGAGNTIVTVDEILSKREGGVLTEAEAEGEQAVEMRGKGVGFRKGVWIDLGKCEWMDHADCIGSCVNPTTVMEVVGLYGRIGRLLEVLPAAEVVG